MERLGLIFTKNILRTSCDNLVGQRLFVIVAYIFKAVLCSKGILDNREKVGEYQSIASKVILGAKKI